MPLFEEVQEHAAQIQAHARTALQKITDAGSENGAILTEVKKLLLEAAQDAVDTLKAADKPADAPDKPAEAPAAAHAGPPRRG